MRPRALASIFVLVLVLAVPSVANAAFSHVVAPGETLSAVAAADGLSVSQLAAANGLSPEAQLVAGTTLAIPALESAAGGETVESAAGSESVESAARGEAAEAAAPSSEDAVAYVVQPGDTLSAIAARSGLSVEGLAALNGLDPEGVLLAGSVVRLAGSAGETAAGSEGEAAVGETPAGSEGEAAAAPAVSSAPYPTEETIAPSEVGAIAEENGVPSSFAEAIANQESGFNNGFRSGSDARGVMQILPGTWSWIGQNLAGGELDPASASANVRGGVLMLHWLLGETGGDPGLAAAGYYQGLESVRREGELPETEQYVRSVLAQQSQFAGE
jgi:LysM repeat protein